MKKNRVWYGIFFSVCYVYSHAQIPSVEALLKSHKLVEAKNTIDSIADVKSRQADAAMWLTKGLVYEAIATTKDSTWKNMHISALLEAGEAYFQAMQSKESPAAKPLAEDRLKKYTLVMVKRTADSLAKSKVINETLLLLDLYARYYATDTLAWLSYAIFADKAQENNTAIAAYEKLIGLKAKNRDYLKALIILYMENADFAQSNKHLQTGKKQFPSDIDFNNLEVELFIKNKKYKEVLGKLDTLILTDKQNEKEYVFNQATVWQLLDSVQIAIEMYEKVLQIDPQHTDALYNLGGIYFQKATDLYDDINELDFQLYVKEGKNTKKQADEWAKKALPYFEKCYKLGLKSETKEILSAIYKNLQMRDKTKQG